MSGVSYLFLVDGYVFSYFSRPRAFPRKCPWSFFWWGEEDLLGWLEGQLIGNTNAASEEKDKRLRFPHKKITHTTKKKAKKEFLHFFRRRFCSICSRKVREIESRAIPQKIFAEIEKSFLNFCILRITLSICQLFGNIGIPTLTIRIFSKSHLAPGHDCSFPRIRFPLLCKNLLSPKEEEKS